MGKWSKDVEKVTKKIVDKMYSEKIGRFLMEFSNQPAKVKIKTLEFEEKVPKVVTLLIISPEYIVKNGIFNGEWYFECLDCNSGEAVEFKQSFLYWDMSNPANVKVKYSNEKICWSNLGEDMRQGEFLLLLIEDEEELALVVAGEGEKTSFFATGKEASINTIRSLALRLIGVEQGKNKPEREECDGDF